MARGYVCDRGDMRLFVGLVLIAACGHSNPAMPDASPVDAAADASPDAATASTVIGPTGGTVSFAVGTQRRFPDQRGRFEHQDDHYVVGRLGRPDPTAATPLFEFGPSGAVYAHPVTVHIPIPPGVTSPQVFWSNSDHTGYEPIAGTVIDNEIVATVVHFSDGYVAPSTSPRTVEGTDLATWITENWIANVSHDLSSTTIEAFVLANGTFTRYSGSGRSDGTFQHFQMFRQVTTTCTSAEAARSTARSIRTVTS